MEIAQLFSVQGKIALVTGGGRGIGKMIAEGYVCNGAKVYIASRDLEACKATAEALTAQGPGSCIALQADVSTEEGCKALGKAMAEREKRLDILVNNSGVASAVPMQAHNDKVWDTVLNVNTKALFFVTREVLPLLDAAASASGAAHVINLGSVGGLQPQMMYTFAYDTSKAAVHQLTRVLAAKLARRPTGGNICVNAIAPGIVPTKMTQPVVDGMHTTFDKVAQKATAVGRVAQPTDMAGVALYLASPASSWVTGIVVCVDGGMTFASEAKLI